MSLKLHALVYKLYDVSADKTLSRYIVDDFEKELKIGFLEEAAQAIADVEQCFLALESDPDNVENLNKIFRLAHNLKGSSKAVGFDEFGHFTHEFETFILRVKNGELKASAAVVNLLLRANDHVSQMIEELKGNLDARFDSTELLSEMTDFQEPTEEPVHAEEPDLEEETFIQQPVQAIEPTSTVDVSVDVSANAPEQEEPVVEVAAVVQPVVVNPAPVVEPVMVAAVTAAQSAIEAPPQAAPVQAVKNTPPPPSTPQASSGGGSGSAPADEYIRVALSKVETLINFVGEMVILQSVLKEQSHLLENPLVRKTVHQLGKVGKEIQDLSMGLRMVPVKPTFQKMVRIVRDTAQALNKEVAIQLQGEDTELDKTVLEKINDPLVHLIRNSVDHGIESVDIRRSRGKSDKGQVQLCAYQKSGKLHIEVIDDGGGLDPEKLQKIAIAKGVLKPGVQLTEKEAYQLIFAPGFSTKEKVTDVSGRGVGMDVVKTNISDLGGEIRIDSAIGKGTTFTIVLPLTLAIVESMVVTYSNNKFVIPLSQVHETLNPKENMVQHSHDLGNVLMLRGENMPLIRLGDFFDIKSSQPLTQMIAMVVRTGKDPFALVVDDILGQFQVVTKPLGSELSDTKGVSGTTILGDGKPALIIECNDLLKRKIKNNYVAPAKGAIKEKVA